MGCREQRAAKLHQAERLRRRRKWNEKERKDFFKDHFPFVQQLLDEKWQAGQLRWQQVRVAKCVKSVLEVC